MSTRAMFTELSIEETDSPLYDWHFNQLNSSIYNNTTSTVLRSYSRSTLDGRADTMSALPSTPDYLSTGAPRLVADWWTCCKCGQMVNPNLAPENRCPCCEHDHCDYCKKETVQ